MNRARDSFATPPLEPAGRIPKTDPRFWKSRLIRRRYTEAIQSVQESEYSTRIEHGGVSFFFPLGSDDEERAAAKAVEIHSTVVKKGWPAAYKMFPREITVAVFWVWNPLVCTYTTLYSLRQGMIPRPPDRQLRKSCRVCLIEPDAGVRTALAFWIDRQAGFRCAQTFSTVRQAVNHFHNDRPHLVLVSRDLIERPGGERMETIREALPDAPAFSFGVYEESNYIFHSVTGVPAGYFLRRRPPRMLFEPIGQLAREPNLSPALLARRIERYFQGLFDRPQHEEKEQEWANLTEREQEILLCLSKGFTDKQIADALDISVWTVHGHVKKVFEKLGVHSRTEAVIKFLQK